ncbi:nucleoid-associated protein [Sinorhizobium meliloti]|uniref:nucleoid-associated protein n=1 Tax=Rhizobium meliloti TaxID=382 RepID=UPI0013E3D936|nr:nucleoid-associated protein [Sinorhizobium meliloti]
MLFENLQVGRIAMHEVLRRDDDRQPKQPVYGTSLENLSVAAKTAFRLRITEALSTQAKSIEMVIAETGAGSMRDIAGRLLPSNDEQFLAVSREVADKLVKAQKSRSIPGGVVIVFDGSFGVPKKRFMAVIKAETQSGFRRNKTDKDVLTEFLENIFLTPATRLYKIGFLVEDSEQDQIWKAFVFDSNISSSHRETAAQYFYEDFLGCHFPSDGAYETSRFFDLTREFIRRADIDQNDKRDLGDALYTFIKTEKAATFTANEFSESYLPIDYRDPFKKFLETRKFPDRAVVRDTSAMGGRLRRRKFKFGDNIELSVPPELLHNKEVRIEQGAPAKFGGDGDGVWTQVTIHRPITDQL